LVEYPGGETRQAMIVNEKVKVGTFVLVQMGIVIEVLSSSQAKLASRAWKDKII
jgi:hydrogenase maturation factor